MTLAQKTEKTVKIRYFRVVLLSRKNLLWPLFRGFVFVTVKNIIIYGFKDSVIY